MSYQGPGFEGFSKLKVWEQVRSERKKSKGPEPRGLEGSGREFKGAAWRRSEES